MVMKISNEITDGGPEGTGEYPSFPSSSPLPRPRTGCILALIGSQARYLTSTQLTRAAEIIQDRLAHYRPAKVISGGCDGIDALAENIARSLGYTVEVYRPLEKRWGGPRGYKWRNTRIAQDCSRLVRIVSRTSTTYGRGWTRDKARELGKPTEEHWI